MDRRISSIIIASINVRNGGMLSVCAILNDGQENAAGGRTAITNEVKGIAIELRGQRCAVLVFLQTRDGPYAVCIGRTAVGTIIAEDVVVFGGVTELLGFLGGSCRITTAPSGVAVGFAQEALLVEDVGGGVRCKRCR